MTTTFAVAATIATFICGTVRGDDTLGEAFRTPPEETKPWCYWYWLDGHISKEGITQDLETMADVGINCAMIGNVTLAKKKQDLGPVRFFSPAWFALTRHALGEANRVGVKLFMFNGPGWSQSGGPWIKPEQSMRRVAWSEFPASGGRFEKMVRPAKMPASQDVAVLAIPRLDAPSIEAAKKDGRLEFAHANPFTARALVVHGTAKGKLYAFAGGKRTLVADINANGGKEKTDFLANEAETFSFKDVTAQRFEFVPAAKCRVVLTSEPRVAQFVEKQMGRMHPTPEPTWESYIFPDTVEPTGDAPLVNQAQIINLTDKLRADGVLAAVLPGGEWTVIHFGMVTTGKRNHPAPPDGTGLECDKMSRAHTRHHFSSQFDELLAMLSPAEKSAFTGVTIDSYEVGAQNWTDGFAAEFEKRNGYSPIPLLPVMTGRVIDSAKASDQFLWDLRRTVADMIAEYYVGGLREAAHEHELTLWCENYGHWGFPGDFLAYGAHSDEVGGEFWIEPKHRGTIECRAASSAAHVYGKQRAYAEAFTSRLELGDHPYAFKARGEELFCEGINHFVLHVYAHQPNDGMPGKNPWFGTPFHRNTPWFGQSRSWTTYLQRCHLMLQQGNPAADVAVYIGDFAPQMIGPANPVPDGYDYDYIGSDAILRRLQVVDGEWVVHDEHAPKRIAARYKLLAMPNVKYIRPHVLERFEELKAQGGRVVNSVPVPVSALRGAGCTPVVSDASCSLRWKARELDDGELFLLSNFGSAGPFEVTLRSTGKAPELFNPVTGEIRRMARYDSVKGGTRIRFNVNDCSDSFFVLFRDKPAAPSVVKVEREGSGLKAELHTRASQGDASDLRLYYVEGNTLVGEAADAGTYTLTMSDGTQRSVGFEDDSRPFAISTPWRTSKQGDYTIRQETTFELPASFAGKDRVILDLGEVSVMAEVTLNGNRFDTLWMPPFELDVTEALVSGENALSVRVTSTSKGEPKLGNAVELKTVARKIVSQE